MEASRSTLIGQTWPFGGRGTGLCKYQGGIHGSGHLLTYKHLGLLVVSTDMIFYQGVWGRGGLGGQGHLQSGLKSQCQLHAA